jgi:hypothetical protein
MWRHIEGGLWFLALVSLLLAAITSGKVLLTLLAILAVGATLVVVPLHFLKAWR